MSDTTQEDDTKTMDELLAEHGYDPDALVNPRYVHADDIDDDTKVVAYTIVHNPNTGGSSTHYDVDEWPIQNVAPTDAVYDYTDGRVSYPDKTDVEHGVHWATGGRGAELFASIGHENAMYGPDSDFDDPQRGDRLVVNVRGLSDDFLRFKFNNDD